MEQPPHLQETQADKDPDMAAIKELHRIIDEAIHYEEQVERIADIIGNVDHITNETEPANQLEDDYTTALVYAEIRAEEIVNIIHPEDFDNDDAYWHAIVNIRLYLQYTDVNEITIDDLSDVINKGFHPCGL